MRRLGIIIWVWLSCSIPCWALNVALPKTWSSGDVLTASDLNSEFTTISTRSIDSTDMATTITWGATGNQYLDMSAITSSTTKGLRLPVGTGGTNAGQASYDATSLWLRLGSGTVANFIPIVAAQGSAGQVLMSQGANALVSWVTSLAATSPSFTLTPTGGVAAGMHSELSGASATEFYLKNGTRWILDEWPGGLVIGGNSAAASASNITFRTTTTGLGSINFPNGAVNLGQAVSGTLPVANGGTGATSLTSNGIVLGGGTGAVTASSALTNGQLLIGSTGVAPVAATLTAGSNVTVTNGAGSITIASTSAVPNSRCAAYNTADISLTSGVDTVMTLNTERWNNDTCHSTTVNTGRLTATTAGTYDICGHVFWANASTGTYRIAYIRLNGATQIAGTSVPPETSANHTETVCTTYVLAANDYVELIANQDTGGALSVRAVVNFSPEFRFTRVE